MDWDPAASEKRAKKRYLANKFTRDIAAGIVVAPLSVVPSNNFIGGNLYAKRPLILDGIKSVNMNLTFPMKELYKRIFLKRVDKNDRLNFFVGNFCAGASAGATMTCFSYPVEQFARFLWPENKRILNNGFFGTLTLVTIHRGLYFGLYDTIKVINSDGQKLNFFVNFSFALATTSIARFISYPFYVIMKPSGRQVYFKDSTTTGIKNLVFSKVFMVRTVAGALALAGFDEIQNWLQ